MRAIRNFAGWVALALFAVTIARAADVPPAAPESFGFSSERLARIGKVLTEEIEKGQYPGAVVLVARKGQIAYFESFGMLDKSSGAPMTKDALFRIYSMTKPFTSVAAMISARATPRFRTCTASPSISSRSIARSLPA